MQGVTMPRYVIAEYYKEVVASWQLPLYSYIGLSSYSSYCARSSLCKV